MLLKSSPEPQSPALAAAGPSLLVPEFATLNLEGMSLASDANFVEKALTRTTPTELMLKQTGSFGFTCSMHTPCGQVI